MVLEVAVLVVVVVAVGVLYLIVFLNFIALGVVLYGMRELYK